MSQSALLDAAAALSTVMDLKKGRLAVCTKTQKTRLSEMSGVFADEAACGELIASEDATVYEAYRTEPPQPQSGNALYYAATIVFPGRVGSEYFQTRGHVHPHAESSEIYLVVRGQGMMLLQTEDAQVQALALTVGTVLYVPGTTAHRLVNTGDQALVTFAVYPASAGYNYTPVGNHGFKRIIVATDDGPDLVPNPSFTQPAR